MQQAGSQADKGHIQLWIVQNNVQPAPCGNRGTLIDIQAVSTKGEGMGIGNEIEKNKYRSLL